MSNALVVCRKYRRSLVAALLDGAAASMFAAFAAAQGYPSKPVRIVVPQPPGGSVDGVARVVAQKMSEQLGQSVFVENRPGSSGTIGAEHVARSQPDGYTLYINASIHAINPFVLKEVRFDAVKDFTPIAHLAQGPLLFTVTPSVPARTVDEFVKAVKADLARYSFATTGFGSAGHLAEALFRLRTGLDIPIALYKGGGPALNDLIGGHVHALMDPTLSSLPHVKAGKIRPLAITAKQRSPLLPEVPTAIEAGLADFEFYSWYGLWGPAGMPADIVAKLSSVAIQVVNAPATKERFAALGFESVGMPSAEFARYIDEEMAKYGKIVREAKIQAE